VEEGAERDLQVLGLRRGRELMADRKIIEGHCSTGQSPQWAVVPMEEEEEEYIIAHILSHYLRQVTCSTPRTGDGFLPNCLNKEKRKQICELINYMSGVTKLCRDRNGQNIVATE